MCMNLCSDYHIKKKKKRSIQDLKKKKCTIRILVYTCAHIVLRFHVYFVCENLSLFKVHQMILLVNLI